MPFRITITQTRDVHTIAGHEWKVVGSEEIQREVSDFIHSRDTEAPLTRIKEVYGFTPQIESVVKQTREILMQEVDELDLHQVIRAINGLSDERRNPVRSSI